MFFPDLSKTALVVIDMQERLLSAMAHPESCTDRTALLIRGAAALGLPVIVTEQYPKGLGPTVSAISSVLPDGTEIFEKSSFSCFGEASFSSKIETLRSHALILCGVESHVCVAQTAWDARLKHLDVFIAQDAVSSRHDGDRDSALAQFRADGIRVVTAETLLFLLLRTSKNPAFKDISKLVK